MTDVDTNDIAALSLHLRNKTALGRLNDAEVRDVLASLADLGMVFAQPEPIEPAPIEPAPIAPPPEA